MPNQDLLEKLRKIKALADEAKDDHECQTAMLMFQRLLTKNGLDTAEVQINGDPEETPEEIDLHSAARIENWMHYLHSAVAKHFRCVPVCTALRRNGKLIRRTLQFLGHKRDATIAAEAFQTALAAAGRLYRRHELAMLEDAALSYDRCAGNQLKPSRSHYMIGFAAGLQDAYRRQEADSTFGIIITIPADVLAAADDYKGIRLHTSAAKRDGNTSAGYTDGFNVGRGDRLPQER